MSTMESQAQGQNNVNDSETPDRRNLRPPAPDRWTDEEVAILRQWQSDSLWYRCVPYSTAFVIGQEALIARGRLQGLAKLNIFIRVPLCMACGFILGRTSSITDLNRRLREQCPDGVVAQFIKQREQMVKGQQQGHQQAQIDELQGDERQDSLPRQERTRLPYPSQGVQIPPPTSPDSQPSGQRLGYYDRLREQSKYSSGGSELAPLPSQQTEEKEPTFFADKPQTPRQRGKKNRYGDDWEE